MDMGVVIKKDGTPGRIYADGVEVVLLEEIEKLIKDSRTQKTEIFVDFLGLSKLTLSVVNVLYKLGYSPIETTRKKDMRVEEFRYRITKDTTYYIQAKTGAKSFVTLQCVENVIGLKQIPQTIDDMENAFKLYHYTRDEFLRGLKGTTTKHRILYSSASMSRTLFNRHHFDFSRANARSRRYASVLETYSRPSVHGGLCMVSELGRTYRGVGIVLDVNSLYDYAAVNYYTPTPNLLSWGEKIPPRKYLNKKLFYTVTCVEVTAALKDDGIACIYPDNNVFGNQPLEKMTKMQLTLTPYDRENLFDNYSISYYRILSYMTWQSSKNTFRDFVLPLYEQKRSLNKGMQRDYVKSMLVGFIGSFARRAFKYKYRLALTPEGDMLYGHRDFLTSDEYEKQMKRLDGLCYLNAAIVSGARHYMLQYIKRHSDRFLYTDTDSIHLIGTEIPNDIPISDKLGDFKVEHTFTDCIYKGQKKYAIVENGKIIPTISGIPKDTHFDSIDDIFTKPFNIYLISEDVENQEVYYIEQPRDLSGEKREHILTPDEKYEEWKKDKEFDQDFKERYKPQPKSKEKPMGLQTGQEVQDFWQTMTGWQAPEYTLPGRHIQK